MKHLLNTLYVMTQNTYLALDGETVAIKLDGQTKQRLPLHTLDGIVTFGYVGCSPGLMHACGERNVTISFMSRSGRFQARVQGPVSGNVLLRRQQYRLADDLVAASNIASAMVAAKIANSRAVLLRGARDHETEPRRSNLKTAAGRMGECLKRFEFGLPLDVVRGMEGEAANHYFSAFADLVVKQNEDFHFAQRNRRPPRDNMNALLSFLYSVLVHDAVSALEGVGLDPAVGFLHRDRPGRPSLALDLMEEIRSVLADRLALSLVNRQQVRSSGFSHTEAGGVVMNDETRKVVLTAYQKRKQEEILHPFLREKLPLGLLLHAQALLLARHLRGDLDAYPPFFWR